MAYRIFLIYHSHIDIGYTQRQELIASYQADFIHQAINCVLSGHQSQRDRRELFRFTAEGFWAVEQYLNKYGQKGKERLLRAIKTGDFELTGGYLHFAEILNLSNLNHSLDFAQNFACENGIDPIRVAMACDINGFSWGFSDCLYEHGIRYLCTNINPHQGGPIFGKPLVPFYWRTPKGKRILVWNGLTYHKANLLGLIPGMAFVGDPGIPGATQEKIKNIKITGIKDHAQRKLFEVIKGLKDKGYSYDFLPLMGGGLYTDNSPCGDAHCDLIREWNEQYGDQVEIVSSTLQEFFTFLEDQPGIEEFSGEWTDWWTDGVMSTPQPMRLFRNAQRTQTLIEKMDGVAEPQPKSMQEALSKNLMLYAEHTWGHSASNLNPGNLLVQQLEYRKTKYAIDADILACRMLDNISQQFGSGELTVAMPFEYLLINPLDSPVKAVAYLPVDYWEAGLFDNGIQVLDDVSVIPSQTTKTLRGLFTAVAVTLGPKEQKILHIKPAINRPVQDTEMQESIFENNEYCLRFTQGEGIVSLFSKKNGQELLSANGHSLGQPLYQIFPGGNRIEANGDGYSARKIPQQKVYTGELATIKVVEHGPVFTVLRATYNNLPSVESYHVQYKLFRDLPQIEMTVEVEKNLEMDPEGLYVALPFQLQGGTWHLDKPGTFVEPNNQLPDACCDYFSVNRGYVMTDMRGGIAINALDTPLVMFGSLKLWQFSTRTENVGTAYSWLLNNKWDTNFKVECSGCHESRYIIEPFSGVNSTEEIQSVLEKNDLGVLALRKSN